MGAALRKVALLPATRRRSLTLSPALLPFFFVYAGKELGGKSVQTTSTENTNTKQNWVDEFEQEINALKNISRHRNICGMFGYRRLETFGVILFKIAAWTYSK